MSKRARRGVRKFVELPCESSLEIKEKSRSTPKKPIVFDSRGIIYLCNQETNETQLESFIEPKSEVDCILDRKDIHTNAKITLIPMRTTLCHFDSVIQTSARIPIETIQFSNLMFVTFYRAVYSDRGHYLNQLNGFASRIFECVFHTDNLTEEQIMTTDYIFDTDDIAYYCLVFNGTTLCISKLISNLNCFDDSDDETFDENYMKAVATLSDIKTGYKAFVDCIRRTEFTGMTPIKKFDHCNYIINIKSLYL